MWAEGERTGLRHLPCLQKPRSYHGQSLILDSGSMCRKGHSLLLHSPAGTPDTRPLRQLAPTRLRPRPPKAGPPSSRGAWGGGAVVSGPGPRPKAQGLKSLSFLTCTWAGMALPSEVTLTEAGTGSTHIK